ncbi:hypothetical protein THII_3619 [Thioploca ingrica]|uniref:Uncharacterized protein n=1 Tax=Thioploca ingrica TaxID=40754 RepID=A0A090BW35_9GAMM|nr:hypothetical protein THII_3619 [Thioploca ingrica]
MLIPKTTRNTIVINGITYIKASEPILRQEELISELSPSLFKVIMLGSIVPLFFLFIFAHLMQ